MSEPYWKADFETSTVKAQFSDRMPEYRAAARKFWTIEALPLAFISAVTIFGLTWIVSRILGVSGHDRWYAAITLFLASMTLAIKIMHSERPTEDSVAYNLMLNRITHTR